MNAINSAIIEWVGPRWLMKNLKRISASGIIESVKISGRLISVLVSLAVALARI
jgi:hypothetical protein